MEVGIITHLANTDRRGIVPHSNRVRLPSCRLRRTTRDPRETPPSPSGTVNFRAHDKSW
jgi:hypothetical protein